MHSSSALAVPSLVFADPSDQPVVRRTGRPLSRAAVRSALIARSAASMNAGALSPLCAVPGHAGLVAAAVPSAVPMAACLSQPRTHRVGVSEDRASGLGSAPAWGPLGVLQVLPLACPDGLCLED